MLDGSNEPIDGSSIRVEHHRAFRDAFDVLFHPTTDRLKWFSVDEKFQLNNSKSSLHRGADPSKVEECFIPRRGSFTEVLLRIIAGKIHNREDK